MEVHDPHRVDEGGDDHEKKPVIKKVKDKVKRIKDKISKKHGHDDEHNHDDYGYSEEGEGYEQDEDDAEKEIDPQGAPIYETGTRRNVASGGDENVGHEKISLGEAMGVEDPVTVNDESQLLYPSSKGAAADRGGNLMTGSTPAAGIEQSHPSLQSSTGRDEVGESPLITAFQAMDVSDESKGRQNITETSPTGTHDQFSHNKAHQGQPGEQQSSTYTDKIASTATAAKDAAVSAAISAYEKVSGAGSAIMGKGTAEAEKYGTKSKQTDQLGQPVSGKVSGAGRTIMGSGTAGSGKYDTKSGQPVLDKGVSMKEYMAGKLRPGDEDRALSEVITDMIHQNKRQEEMNTSAGSAREASSKDGGGKGMVEKIKGAVTSWIGAGAHPSEKTDTEIKENQ